MVFVCYCYFVYFSGLAGISLSEFYGCVGCCIMLGLVLFGSALVGLLVAVLCIVWYCLLVVVYWLFIVFDYFVVMCIVGLQIYLVCRCYLVVAVLLYFGCCICRFICFSTILVCLPRVFLSYLL